MIQIYQEIKLKEHISPLTNHFLFPRANLVVRC